MSQLPVDAVIPELIRTLKGGRSVVVEAPPGAGKTTRIPWALMEGVFSQEQEILVLEPRRLPARLAAHRVAFEHGEKVGLRVGYAVRFEEACGPETRIRYMTEGILARRLLEDPELKGIGAVVFDEFHERHIYTDLCLALVRRLQKTKRPDLAIVAMSATMDAAPLAEWIGAAGIRSEGRLHEVRVEYLSRDDARPVHERTSAACRDLVRSGNGGDILAFLPGASEISRTMESLSGFSAENDVVLCPLHGEMTLEAQNRAVTPLDRRKIILSTNVAETSVTIEGVTAVVDSGLARVASHSPWSGLPTLRISKISRASAEQRSGRAGRTGPGTAIRLYTKADFDRRHAHELPEIKRADLAETVLFLKAAGVVDPSDFEWFEPPPSQSLEAAEDLLERLGALKNGGRLTEIGRRMAAYPLHPRLARVVVEGERSGCREDAALAAAVLSERTVKIGNRPFGTGGVGRARNEDTTEIDLIVEEIREAEKAGRLPEGRSDQGYNRGATASVARTWRQLKKLTNPKKAYDLPSTLSAEALGKSLLSGFPDRVGKLREAGSKELLLSSGGTAELPASISDSGGRYFIVLEAEERSVPGTRSRVQARLTSAMEPEWLLEFFPERIAETSRLEWNEKARRVEQVKRMSYDSLILDESVSAADPSKEASVILASEALKMGTALLDPDGSLSELLSRIRFLQNIGGSGDGEFAGIETNETGILVRACQGLTGMDELVSFDVKNAFLASIGNKQRELLSALAPEKIALPGGRTLRVHYEDGKQPWVESYLQDFFGMKRSPSVAGGKVGLTVRLLAPNKRPVQVTSDLEGFWKNHYPSVRKELCRRYPRHSWPEDGSTARPTGPGRRR